MALMAKHPTVLVMAQLCDKKRKRKWGKTEEDGSWKHFHLKMIEKFNLLITKEYEMSCESERKKCGVQKDFTVDTAVCAQWCDATASFNRRRHVRSNMLIKNIMRNCSTRWAAGKNYLFLNHEQSFLIIGTRKRSKKRLRRNKFSICNEWKKNNVRRENRANDSINF